MIRETHSVEHANDCLWRVYNVLSYTPTLLQKIPNPKWLELITVTVVLHFFLAHGVA